MVATETAVLTLDGLTARFGAFTAVADVSLEVRRGELLGLIGPNGAGKTTLLNLVSGHTPATRGTVSLQGRNVTSMPTYRRARLGMARSYQTTTLFAGLSVRENVWIAAAAKARAEYQLLGRRGRRREIEQTCEYALHATGLEGDGHKRAAALGHGQARVLEVAMLLAVEPSVMLLDEPAAGMAAGEVGEVIETIARVRRETDVTIMLIEHKMSLIFGVSDRIAVLDRGRLIAVDVPARIAANAAVRDAYLGNGGLDV
jgi:branched-chain amino acid transport system ATP-binding protein